MPIRLVVGTRFPWYDRFNRLVTTLHGWSYAMDLTEINRVSVKINEQPCTVVPFDPMFPGIFIWVYAGSTIDVGQNATVYDLTMQLYYDGNPVPIDHGGKLELHTNIFDIGSSTLPGHTSSDIVSTSSTCYWRPPSAGGPDGIAGSPLGVNTRELVSYCKVTAPTAANNDLRGITVGIIQTMNEESVLGSISYRKASDSTAGTLYHEVLYPAIPLPWWDGDGNTPCYYREHAVQSSPGYTPDNTWEVGPLFLTDTPWERLTDRMEGSDLWYWGYWVFSGNRVRGGTPREGVYEVMLSASSSSLPYVVVPIYGYKKWSVTFDGYLSPTFVWSLGGTADLGSTGTIAPVADTTKGPANSREKHPFRIP